MFRNIVPVIHIPYSKKEKKKTNKLLDKLQKEEKLKVGYVRLNEKKDVKLNEKKKKTNK